MSPAVAGTPCKSWWRATCRRRCVPSSSWPRRPPPAAPPDREPYAPAAVRPSDELSPEHVSIDDRAGGQRRHGRGDAATRTWPRPCRHGAGAVAAPGGQGDEPAIHRSERGTGPRCCRGVAALGRRLAGAVDRRFPRMCALVAGSGTITAAALVRCRGLLVLVLFV